MRAWFAVITDANTVTAFKYSVWKHLCGHRENFLHTSDWQKKQNHVFDLQKERKKTVTPPPPPQPTNKNPGPKAMIWEYFNSPRPCRGLQLGGIVLFFFFPPLINSCSACIRSPHQITSFAGSQSSLFSPSASQGRTHKAPWESAG